MNRSGSLTEIQKEAAEWLIEMDLKPDDWDRKGFLAWLKLSPRHMEEYLEQHALWVAFHEIEPGDIDVDQLRNDSGNVIHWPRTKDREQRHTIVKHRRGWLATLVATAAVLVCAAMLWGVLLDNDQTLITAIGEQRAVRLPDGSTLHLNTDTRVEIRFTDAAREVRLRKGEAMFTVERDVNRPFRVTADGIGFEALGTQFNVRRRASGTTISVVEGRVAVISEILPPSSGNSGSNHVSSLDEEAHVANPPRPPASVPYEGGRPPPTGALAVVAAGEQVRVSVDGSIKEEAIENVTAWRQRQLIFANTPLSEVAAEVARYNVTPRLIIEGENLQSRPLNGVFAADDPESLLQFLRHEGLSVTRSGDTVLIRSLKAFE